MNKKQSPGRPTKYNKPMKRVILLLPDNMIEHIKSQPCGMSEFIRRLVEKSMKESNG